MSEHLYTRRTVLRAGGGVVALSALGPWARPLAQAAAAGVRQPGALPDPSRPAGTPTQALPFDHLVIVMMENHSFDNYLGMLPRRGQPRADGFAFDRAGRPRNSNPVHGGYIVVQRAQSKCQPSGPSQGWTTTHRQIDGGRMDGFARAAPASMLYWDEADIPFYYSLARTFTVANRWFCSAPCQTYPNRRFLLAGTAFGLISTDVSSVTQDPPNGTIVDRLDAHAISWRDYYTDVPATGVIASIPERHPQNLASISQFYADCAAGTLPAVSFVDSDIGAAGVVGGDVIGRAPFAGPSGDRVSTQSESEEGPADIALGENFVSRVANAVLASPAWRRTLLVWTYDEHGGYYDHVPPPRAIPPDSIPPKLGPGDAPGGYDIYGPRVPAVVMSPRSKPGAVTDVVHDHTSILATIEAKWNLPAMTFRDANAATLADFLAGAETFPEPPKLAAPGDVADSEAHCSLAEPTFTVHRAAPVPGSGGAVRPSGHVVVHVHGARLELRLTHGSIDHVLVELLRGVRVIARARLRRVGPRMRPVALGRIRRGRYTLVVRHDGRTLLRRRMRLGGLDTAPRAP